MNHFYAAVLGAAAVLAGIPASGAVLKVAAPQGGTGGPQAGEVPITWQHHRMKFSYFGITVLYSCDALEDQVRRILVYLGARSDLKVTASGCPRGPGAPSRDAWVDADFTVPAPADPPAAGAPGALWTRVDLTPKHPKFMGKGDCELIRAMQDLVTKSFSTRSLDYSTSCFPGELTDDGFAVGGEALKVTLPKSG